MYFSDCFSKAALSSFDQQALQQKDDYKPILGVVFLCEVALGNMHRTMTFD
jgi:hypothetical protein